MLASACPGLLNHVVVVCAYVRACMCVCVCVCEWVSEEVCILHERMTTFTKHIFDMVQRDEEVDVSSLFIYLQLFKYALKWPHNYSSHKDNKVHMEIWNHL